MHNVCVRVSRTAPRWLSRVLFLATLLIAWVVAGPAYARTLAQLALPVSEAPSGERELSSSAFTPPMSLRRDPARASAASSRAPLCDLRCATTFAPAPQFQDEEVSLALNDDAPDAAQLDAARMVPAGQEPIATSSQPDPCLLGAQSVLPATPTGLLARACVASTRGPRGVRTAVDRPPR